jgi:acyl transferase domain-containing protein
VAVCQACQSLLHYQCDLALAGGSSILPAQGAGYIWQQGGINSPDGRCRAFDAAAQGTVAGSGAGIVALRRYDDAVASGDCIRAVIRGFGLTNDGSDKVGYTAPSIDGQARAIMTAIGMAGLDAEQLGYIEAHGTATALGDPIEVAALAQVFRSQTSKRQFCGIGSVKTNIGHLGAAAGVASLIKTVLALQHGAIPPSLHYQRPNPNIDFDSSPFFVVDGLRRWERNGSPRRAGVSSFGVGGTNAHVVLEEAPAATAAETAGEWQLLTLSAKEGAALDQTAANLSAHLYAHPSLCLADAAYTLQTGRQPFAHRRVALVRGTTAEATDVLAGGGDGAISAIASATSLPVVFLFSGQGTQHVGMGRGLYESEPAFRDNVDHCCALLRDDLGFDLRAMLYPDPGQPTEVEAAAHELAQTAVAQPALFVVEYALAQLWMSWGVRPAAMAGHSLGEYVAACLAGVFSLNDALHLIAVRGRMMQAMPPGAMLAVHLAETELVDLLRDGLSLAAANGATLSVISGPHESIAGAEKLLSGRGVSCQRVHTSHAFHSASMDPVVPALMEQVRMVRRQRPSLPYLSNLTGIWIEPEQATDPAYWGRHVRDTVRFWQNLQTLQDGQWAKSARVARLPRWRVNAGPRRGRW